MIVLPPENFDFTLGERVVISHYGATVSCLVPAVFSIGISGPGELVQELPGVDMSTCVASNANPNRVRVIIDAKSHTITWSLLP